MRNNRTDYESYQDSQGRESDRNRSDDASTQSRIRSYRDDQRGSQPYNDPYRTSERGSQSQNYGQQQYDRESNRNQHTGGQNYQPSNREASYRNQRDTDDRYNRQYRDDENRGYRAEEQQNYRSEAPSYREQNQRDQYNVDRVDPAMASLEYGYAYGYPFGLQWGSRGNEGNRYEPLRCRDIMTRDVTTCTPETSIREVADRLEDENVGSLPVVENGRLIGIVTDRDIVCRVLAEGMDTRTATVREAMTEDIVTCSPDEMVVEAIHKMGEHQVRRLPVCDSNGRIRGILSLGDLALEAENDQDIGKALEHISQATPYQSRRR